MIKHDVVVIGGGLAGMRAAVEAAERGADVAIVSKMHPVRSHSGAAQGGINAALGNREDDSPLNHAFDCVKGSDYLGDQDAIEAMCEDAPRQIIWLEHRGCIFSRLPDGRIAQRPFGGAGSPRTCYSADVTGLVILHTLWEQLERFKVKVYEEYFCTALCVEDGVGSGVVAYNLRNGELELVTAKAVIFATGGLGRMYAKTTNGYASTADGLGIALRAGLPLMDMEFVQFHPTSLKENGVLLSEAARGEGAYLLNADGERFMFKYAPNKGELASRDVVSRAEWTEILEGRGVEGCVLLDLRHLGREKILERLPQIRELALDATGKDAINEPIPILPGMHYAMGGIETDKNGATRIPGVYAAGETACVSVHGANRLGGNSLLETIVFGARSARHAIDHIKSNGQVRPSEKTLKSEQDRMSEMLGRSRGERAPQIRKRMNATMSKNCFIFREKTQLQQAIDDLRETREAMKSVVVMDKSKTFNTDLVGTLETQFLIDAAQCVATGALSRTESRGAQARTDYPERDDTNWLVHSLAWYTDSAPRMDYSRKVTFTKWQPEVRSY
ncbi:MAG: succinate dehydrogenase/fumarate reductase flavoprotein subunit [Candidatus Meridianibacter frigidus]|nr:MAG: succinate dehydrogenase/fumarate reductase flavoprotein subunit [Candidatus Eremiobacteraeota bacterium]